MAHPQIAAFARLANGGDAPERTIAGQQTTLSRTMHDIRYDAIHDEIFVGNPFSQAILVFRGGANGEEAPIRTIQGPSTQLQVPDNIEIDPVNNEIYVPDRAAGKIFVFPRDADGDVAPIRILRSEGSTVIVDPIHNVLVTSITTVMAGGETDRNGRGLNTRSALQIFDRLAEGDAEPLRVIEGPSTGLLNARPLAMYPEGGYFAVAQKGSSDPKIYFDRSKDIQFVGIWSIYDEGDVPPRWRLETGMRKPRGIALNPRAKELMIVDMGLNSVLTYSLPEMFD